MNCAVSSKDYLVRGEEEEAAPPWLARPSNTPFFRTGGSPGMPVESRLLPSFLYIVYSPPTFGFGAARHSETLPPSTVRYEVQYSWSVEIISGSRQKGPGFGSLCDTSMTYSMAM